MPKRSLSGLLTILREHGVVKYKDEKLEIEFGPRAQLRDPMIETSQDSEEEKPAQKKTPEEIDEEILFYSA
jgi:hypothetical protein